MSYGITEDAIGLLNVNIDLDKKQEIMPNN
jgi:hypothetical protein